MLVTKIKRRKECLGGEVVYLIIEIYSIELEGPDFRTIRTLNRIVIIFIA
jgi:hypothetical protein